MPDVLYETTWKADGTVEEKVLSPEEVGSRPLLMMGVDGNPIGPVPSVNGTAPPEEEPAALSEPVGAIPFPHGAEAGGRPASASLWMDEYPDGDNFVPVEIQGWKVWIKELDIYSLLDVVMARTAGKPGRDAKLALSFEFAATLHEEQQNQNTGEISYLPMFRVDGMDTDSELPSIQSFIRRPRAKALINDLAEAVYAVNPDLLSEKKRT